MTVKPPRSSELSPAVEALLAQERAQLPIADDVRDRVLSRAHATVRAGPSGRAASAPPPGSSRPLIAAAAGVVVIAGFFAVRQVREPAPSRAAASAAAPALPSFAPPVASGAILEPTTAPGPSSAARSAVEERSSGVRSASPSRPDDGPGELSLLSRARQADGRGDFAAVLGLVGEHTQKYPSGRLSEEREVLRVKALVGLGRGDEARRAAAQFRRRFPRSVLLHKVDEMVPSLP
jgi:hypothetical protein